MGGKSKKRGKKKSKRRGESNIMSMKNILGAVAAIATILGGYYMNQPTNNFERPTRPTIPIENNGGVFAAPTPWGKVFPSGMHYIKNVDNPEPALRRCDLISNYPPRDFSQLKYSRGFDGGIIPLGGMEDPHNTVHPAYEAVASELCATPRVDTSRPT